MAGSAQGSPWTAGVHSRPRLRFEDDQGGRPAGSGRASTRPGRRQDQEAHALGRQVLAWTVNDAATAGRLIDLGVDGIVTDRPTECARR